MALDNRIRNVDSNPGLPLEPELLLKRIAAGGFSGQFLRSFVKVDNWTRLKSYLPFSVESDFCAMTVDTVDDCTFYSRTAECVFV